VNLIYLFAINWIISWIQLVSDESGGLVNVSSPHILFEASISHEPDLINQQKKVGSSSWDF
jgi:hypothetical protein